MTWSIVGVGSGVDGTGSTTPTEPAGVQQGDLLVAVVAYEGGTLSAPSGWTVLQHGGDTLKTMIAYIKREASAPSLTFSGATNVTYGVIVAYRTNKSNFSYVNSALGSLFTTSPISVSGFSVQQGDLLIAAGSNGASTGNFSSFDNATVATVSSGATDTSTDPTSNTWIERFDSRTTLLNDAGIGIADALAASSGASGDFSVSHGTPGGDTYLCAMAFREALGSSQAFIIG